MPSIEVQKYRSDLWCDIQMFRRAEQTVYIRNVIIDLTTNLKDLDADIKAEKSDCEILGHKYHSDSPFDMQGTCIRCGKHEE